MGVNVAEVTVSPDQLSPSGTSWQVACLERALRSHGSLTGIVPFLPSSLIERPALCRCKLQENASTHRETWGKAAVVLEGILLTF